jgi:hypothetical protein
MSDRDATGLARLQIVTFDNDEIEQSTSVMEEMDSVVGLNPFFGANRLRARALRPSSSAGSPH